MEGDLYLFKSIVKFYLQPNTLLTDIHNNSLNPITVPKERLLLFKDLALFTSTSLIFWNPAVHFLTQKKNTQAVLQALLLFKVNG